MKRKKLGQKYQYTTKIGQGTHGTVYKGKIIQTNEPIAVKVIDFCDSAPKQATNQKYHQRAITREIHILKILNSQNIIKLIEVLQSRNNRLYIVQQYANQGSLQDIIKQQKIQQQTAIEYLIQIVNGMVQLVSNGFIHRDLKPANILVKDGILKIGDFGESRKSFEHEKLKSYVGSPMYMAPQVLIKDQYNYKCDIWSLGVICYEMVVGQVPWMKGKIRNRKDIYQNILKFTSEGVRFPPQIKISTTLKGFIRNCLEFQEYNRFDWIRIFLHPIFKGKFKMNAIQKGDFVSGFAMTKLRKSIHQQNLNIENLFKQLSEQIIFEQFMHLLMILQPSITEQDVFSIFKNISDGKQIVAKQKILEYFHKSAIDLKGITYEQMNRKYMNKSDIHLRKTIQRICKIIESQKIDMFELFFQKQNFENQGQTTLTQQKFNKIMLKLDNKLDEKTLNSLFVQFDQNKDKQISYGQLYNKLCKMNRIIFIKNQNMVQTLKKVLKGAMKKQEKHLAISSI